MKFKLYLNDFFYFILYKTPYEYACNDNFKSLIDYNRLLNENKHLGIFMGLVRNKFKFNNFNFTKI